ncbi:MAG: Ribonuclease [Betaproteobacteria bacterium]|nr:Ribonuclease [Betaproteobacteria bacterium]
MSPVAPQFLQVVKNPLGFAVKVLKAFNLNQGLLLAGAVAYYALLSIIPLLILIVIALSHVIDQQVLLTTLRRALEYVVPGQSYAVVTELSAFLDQRQFIGWVLLVTMIFFSQLGFKVLENAISVIFLHRIAVRRRHFAVSLLLPFGYIIFIGAVLVAVTFVLTDLMSMGEFQLEVFGHTWSLTGGSQFVLYAAGVATEILLISAVYYFMPVGRLSPQHALIGGASAGALWEIIRHGLRWYFGTLSQVSVLYGSLATAIIVLLSFEVAATVLLLGAQVIAEYERIEPDGTPQEPVPLRADSG